MALDGDEAAQGAAHLLGADHPEPLEPDLAFHVGHDPGGQVLHAVGFEPGGEVVGPVGLPVVLDHVGVAAEETLPRDAHHQAQQTVHVVRSRSTQTHRVEQFVLGHDPHGRQEGLLLRGLFGGVLVGALEHAGQVFEVDALDLLGRLPGVLPGPEPVVVLLVVLPGHLHQMHHEHFILTHEHLEGLSAGEPPEPGDYLVSVGASLELQEGEALSDGRLFPDGLAGEGAADALETVGVEVGEGDQVRGEGQLGVLERLELLGVGVHEVSEFTVTILGRLFH